MRLHAVVAQVSPPAPKMPPVQFPISLWWIAGPVFGVLTVICVLILISVAFKWRWPLKVVALFCR